MGILPIAAPIAAGAELIIRPKVNVAPKPEAPHANLQAVSIHTNPPAIQAQGAEVVDKA
jgi:hypothetical protein